LRGVGPYTAAAIASIAYDEAVAAVDGNVERVISRLFEVGEAVNSSKGNKIIREYANQILDSCQAGTFNQALMEFGALQCLPQNPKCASCPLANQCGAYQKNMVMNFPVKIKNTKRRTRYFIYIIFHMQGFTYIRQRTSRGIWQQLFEFPLIESDNPISSEEIEGKIVNLTGFTKSEFIIKAISKPVKHQLSHQTIIAKFVHIEVFGKDYKGFKDWMKIKMKKFSDYPIPRIIDRYMESYNQNTD
jgi:A/G-specific adenine glycosylase